MSTFLSMGGYGWYVWMAYGVTALVIAVLQLGLLHRVDASTGIDRTTIGILATVVGYILLVSLLNLRIRRRACRGHAGRQRHRDPGRCQRV